MRDFVETNIKQFWLGVHLNWIPVRELIDQQGNEEKAEEVKKNHKIKMAQFVHKGTYKVLELEKKAAEDKYKQRDFLEELYQTPDGKNKLKKIAVEHKDSLQIKKIAERNHENTRPEKRLS